MPRTTDIRLRRGTAAAWASANPTLSAGEVGYETDTGLVKVGDGSTLWNALAYAVSVPSTVGPPAGWSFRPKYILSGSQAAVGSLAGRVYYIPFEVGTLPDTIAGIQIQVQGTPQSGGAITCRGGIYGSDSNGWLRRTGGPLASADFAALTSTGIKTATFAAAITLKPGIWWAAVLFNQTSTPTAAPQFSCINNSTGYIPMPSGTFSSVRGLYEAATAFVSSDATTPTADTTSTCPVVQILAA